MPDQNQDNLPVPVSHAKRNKIILVLVIVAVLLAAGILVFKSLPAKKPVLPQTKNQTTASTTPTLAQYQAVVNKYSKLTIPTILNSQTITQDKLPAQLAGFIIPSSTNVSISQVNYTGGQTGYEVSYQVPGAFSVLSQQLPTLGSGNPQTTKSGKLLPPPPSGYIIIAMARTNMASLIEEQDSKYQIKIQANYIDANTSKVDVLIVSK